VTTICFIDDLLATEIKMGTTGYEICQKEEWKEKHVKKL
jgi:hypothetical protein